MARRESGDQWGGYCNGPDKKCGFDQDGSPTFLKCELQALNQCVGDGGDEVMLLGQCLAHGRYSININGKNKV